MIRVVDFSHVYGKNVAVDRLSFDVQAGDVLGLVGPNGAGKTTTLRALAGVLEPTAGTLEVEGFDVVAKPMEAKSRLALVPDTPQLFESLTVWEHLEFTAAVYGLSDWGARADALLGELELDEQREALADELSHGMRQKVVVASALLHRPTALLLDEPLTGLDPRGIRTLYGALKERARQGASVVVSTHLLGQIEGLCNRYLILGNGRRLFYGSREQILSELPALRGDATLEEIFFEATEGAGG